MSETDRPSTSAAPPFATGFGVAFASALLELVLPWVVGPEGDRFAPDAPLVRTVFLAGGVLRIPLTAAAFTLLRWVFDPSGKKIGAGRILVMSLAALVLLVDATSYRWLGSRGTLFHLTAVLSPLEAFEGRGGLISITAAFVALLFAMGVESLLEPPLRRRFERKGAAIADALGLGLLAVVGIGGVVGARDSLALGITPPLVALLQSRSAHTEVDVAEPQDEAPPLPADGIAIPPPDVRGLVHHALATEAPEPLADPSRPFCREARTPDGARPTPRSVVLLIIRGLDAAALAGATPAMPLLATALRDEARFERVISGTDDPTQGLVQLLSGVAPLAPSRYHEIARVPRLPSLPSALRPLGVESHYVTTADLSPGRERTYLRHLGFTSIEEPTIAAELAADPAVPAARRTLDAVRRKLEATRSTPRLVVATLGSALSGGLDASDEASRTAARTAALAAIDTELGSFLADFRANEASRGTVLAIVSDSVDPTVVVRGDGDEASRPSFHVPFALVNLRADEKTLARQRATMLAGLLDVAQTLLGLEGQGPTGCFHGRDLLSTREPIPSDRRLFAFAGADQRYAYVFDTRFRWQLDRTALDQPFAVYDLEQDPGLTRNLFEASDPDVGTIRDLAMSYVAIGRYMASNDRFVPGTNEIVATPLPEVAAPERVGLVTGGSVAELARGLGARSSEGLGAVVLNVGFDATGRPSLGGVPLGEALASLARPLRTLRVMLDVALPEPASPERSVAASRVLLAELAQVAGLGSVVLMPRDPLMATSLANRSEYDVFVRLPGNALGLVDAAHGFGVDGIVFGDDLASGIIVERARLLGLRVAVDDVARFEAVRELGGGQLPDYLVVGAAAAPR